jgi:hypothetical protein
MAEDEAKLAQARSNAAAREALLKEQVVGKAEVDDAASIVESTQARIAVLAAADRRLRAAGRAAEDDARRHGRARAVQRRRDLEGRAAGRDDLAGVGRAAASRAPASARSSTCRRSRSKVDVNETYINRVLPGQKVEAVLDAYQSWQDPAHVITTIPSADRQKATVKVRIGFDGLDPRILPDMGVKVSFLRDEPAAGQPAPAAASVIVPKAAIRSADGKSIVFVVNEDRAERRAVRVGLENGDQVEVLSGVRAGERGGGRWTADAQGRRQGEDSVGSVQ